MYKIFFALNEMNDNPKITIIKATNICVLLKEAVHELFSVEVFIE